MPASPFSREYQLFRKMLVDARRAAGLTQRKVAERLKEPQNFVSKYERGERRIDVVEFLKVAKALEFDPAEFLLKLQRAIQRGRRGKI